MTSVSNELYWEGLWYLARIQIGAWECMFWAQENSRLNKGRDSAISTKLLKNTSCFGSCNLLKTSKLVMGSWMYLYIQGLWAITYLVRPSLLSPKRVASVLPHLTLFFPHKEAISPLLRSLSGWQKLMSTPLQLAPPSSFIWRRRWH